MADVVAAMNLRQRFPRFSSHEQLRCVFDVAFIEFLANVINDHCSDGFAAVRLLQQVAGERGSRYFRDMLVLADRGDFVLVETAHADTIFQRNHICHLAAKFRPPNSRSSSLRGKNVLIDDVIATVNVESLTCDEARRVVCQEGGRDAHVLDTDEATCRCLGFCLVE